MLSYVPNHSKQQQTTKVIKLQWIASIWCQNDKKCWVTSQTIPNNAKLQKWSNYDEVHGFDVKTIKNVELRPKPFETQQTYKSNQITMNCIDLMSKTSNNAKLQKWSNYEEVHGFDVKTIKNVELRPKPFQTQQNYKSDQITMKCMDLTSKRTKMLSYVPNHSKQLKPTKVMKLQWIASIWCQKHLRKTTKVIKLRWIASIWRQNEQKCWVTSQTIQNNANLQK